MEPIVADKVSTSRLRDMGRNCDVFHCCCHGNFDHDAPLLSNIQLHSKAGPGDLSVMDLVTMVGPAKLVVLSACFSGFGKILGSNDGYGFPHALLSIGVRAFVGSLWSSDDGAALIFMFIFYRKLLHGWELKEDFSGDDVSIAQAFTSAQRQLRSMSRAAYNECIDSIISELKAIDPKTSRRVVGMSQQLFRLKVLKEDRDPARFADPFYWAAFVLTGNGLQTMRG
jgi:CHAT domain-containing protein